MQTSLNERDNVVRFLNALNSEDFDTAQNCVADNLSFVGVMGTREGAENYFGDMKKMRLKYEIKKVFADRSDVCVLYDIKFNPKITLFACGWYQSQAGKINSIRVIFDPRPLIEQRQT